jgi:DUF4097 and DUF4098 domain-containing protein YvlB
MSRTKKAVIAASIMIVAGIIIVISAFAVNGFRWPNVTVNLAHMTSEPVNYIKKTVDIKDKFSSIEVKSASDVDVAVKKASGDTSYVEYYDCENLTHHVDVSDGVLRITADDSRNVAFNVSIGLYTGAWPSVTVYLAGTEYDDLKIVTSSGDIDMEYYLLVGNIDIEASSGDVTVNGSNSDSLTIATRSGNIKIDSASSKDTRISANSGDVSLGDVVTDNVDLKTSSGNITSGSIKAKRINGRASSGDVMIRDCDASEINIMTNSGDVSIGIGSEMKYEYTTKTSSGDVNVPDSVKGADGKCNIETSSGDIDVTQ